MAAAGTMTVAQAEATFSAINPAFVSGLAQNGTISAANVGYLYRIQANKTGSNPLGINTMSGTNDAALAVQVAAAAPAVAAMPAAAVPVVSTPVASTPVTSSPAPVATSTPAGPAHQWHRSSGGYSGGGRSSSRGSSRSRGGGHRKYSGGGRGSAGWTQPVSQPQTQQTYVPGLSILTPQEAAQIQHGQNIAAAQAGLGYYARAHGLGATRTPGRANRPSSSGSGRSWTNGQSGSGWTGGGSNYYGGGPSYYSGYGGAQPVTATDQGTTLTQEGYLEELQQLYGSSAATALSTAASVPITTSAVNPSWFSEQTIISGVPNWGIVAGGAVLLWFLMKRR